MNDNNAFQVTKQHVIQALDSARGGPVAEGNVGGGTGMICNQFKGGIGTSSRRLGAERGGYTVGVLVQCNYGLRARLSIAGVPVGQEIPDLLPTRDTLPTERGSIIIVIATDAPLLPHQLKRIAKRASLGVGRLGGTGGNTSGDIFIAFSTANPGAAKPDSTRPLTMLPNERISPLFDATIQATEEAIVNAMVAAETMTGADGLRVYALPHDRLRAALRKYNRLAEPAR
jgi:D-aminopeptidase